MPAFLELATDTAQETRAVGKAIAEVLGSGDVISLTGDLGAGKTTLVQGMAKGLGVTQPVLSPTFTLVRTYELRTLEPFRNTDVWDKVDPFLRAIVEGADSYTGVDVVKAEDACHRLNGRLVEVFRHHRLLLCPTTAAAPPRCGEPGIIMLANPQIPDAYRQEYQKGNAEDTAWIVNRGTSASVPFGTLHNVLTSLEFARIEPNVVDQKIYAPGIGIVRETALTGPPEVAKLVRVIK